MQIQPELLLLLLNKSDEELWQTMKAIALSNGVHLPRTMPTSEDMKKLRAILQSGNQMDMNEAIKIVESYKNGERK